MSGAASRQCQNLKTAFKFVIALDLHYLCRVIGKILSLKHFHLYIILAIILSSTVFAQQQTDRQVVENDSIAPVRRTDTAAVARARAKSSPYIDSIRNAMSLRRKYTHAQRPSLRSNEFIHRDSARTMPADTLGWDKVVADTIMVDTIASEVITPKIPEVTADSLTTTVQDSIAAVRPVEQGDTLANDTLPAEKPMGKRIVREKVDIEAAVDFSAKDSLVLIGQNTAFMYGESNVKYTDIDLAADEIRMDMKESLVYAVGRKDSTDEVVGSPVFKDASGQYESKTMNYNFKTGKGFITDVVTEQGEGYLIGGKTKKLADNTYNIIDGKYTTCEDHEHPHFYFQLTKGKMKPKKNIVTGPAYLVLCDVPLPLAVPFGFFPFTSKYSSGIIVPTFGDDYNRGFYLSDGGYYFALSDYFDLALTGEIYTKGSWGLGAQSSYKKRYKYSGNFNLSYITTITGDKGSPDYMKQKNFRLAWTHTQDPKANPNMNLSASVNFATSGYSRNDLNSYYNQSFTENTKNSTVNFSYRFSSKFQMSTTASVAQRTQDSTLSVSFPNVTLSLSQVAPFKRKRAVGSEKWYEKIKLSYTGTFQNSLTAKQDVFFKKSLIKDWNNGMRHSMPVSATFNLFQYINVTPNIQMNDRMYTRKVRRAWDSQASREVMDTTYGFYNVFDFNASVSLDTKIYGFFQPMKFLGDKVKMIRHVMSPSITFSGSPDFSKPFWGYYGNYSYVDADGRTQHRDYSYYGGNIFGSVSQGKTGMVSFSLANNVEMKVKSDADSTGVKKISLIENFNISQSYNFAADSMRWSNVNTSLSLRLTKNFNLNLSATWDPYTYRLSESGTPVKVDVPRWKVGKGWVKLASTGTSFSYTFNNDTFKRKKKKKDTDTETPKNDMASTDPNENPNNRNGNSQNEGGDSGYDLDSDGYVKWKCPWSLTFNYSVNYGYGEFDKNKLEYKGKFTQNLSFNGRIQPTKGWNFSFSSSYDFEAKKIAYMNCSISRDLHCFTMTASFVPVGPYKSYNFHIAVKSSLLQDLKYDKRSSMANGVDWY